jgi:hypothetical protein
MICATANPILSHIISSLQAAETSDQRFDSQVPRKATETYNLGWDRREQVLISIPNSTTPLISVALDIFFKSGRLSPFEFDGDNDVRIPRIHRHHLIQPSEYI